MSGVGIKSKVQGFGRLQNRSLLGVNEDFEGKRNTEIYFLVTPFSHIHKLLLTF